MGRTNQRNHIASSCTIRSVQFLTVQSLNSDQIDAAPCVPTKKRKKIKCFNFFSKCLFYFSYQAFENIKAYFCHCGAIGIYCFQMGIPYIGRYFSDMRFHKVQAPSNYRAINFNYTPIPLATLIYRWFTLTLYLGHGRRYKILCAKFRLQALSRSQLNFLRNSCRKVVLHVMPKKKMVQTLLIS